MCILKVQNCFNFQYISNLSELKTYLKATGRSLFTYASDGHIPSLRTQTVLVGPVRIRSQRRAETGWNVDLGNSTIKWYTDSESTIDIGSGTYDWQKYKSDSTTKVTLNIDGLFASYEGGGYVVDFDPMNAGEAWDSKIDELSNNGYFDQSMMWLILTLTIYNPTSGGWISSNILFEFSKLGLISPSATITKTFIPNLFETSDEQGLRAVEFLRLFLTIYIITFWIVIKIVQLPSINRIFSIEMMLHLGSDITIVSLIISIFAIVIALSSDTTQTLVDASDYTDFAYKSYLYKLIFILESYLLNIILLKLLQSLSVFQIVRIVILSIGLSLRMMIAYTIIFFPILTIF